MSTKGTDFKIKQSLKKQIKEKEKRKRNKLETKGKSI